ncbi:hypothetical protein RSOLAG1IB_06573 [Rhizoctonia solani AG-1 IB]|uniref:Uncharacterized protein n=1 Tax=Thanatephorus cucumeris (strain AG1-IB / isolate 7/3/14) TaxID=1108050 RepID=A0A0B7FC26_THACB|nr:hypothetical protein RSOLAG1IB_06573 [Rhizoctonia solani AG-1 IB]
MRDVPVLSGTEVSTNTVNLCIQMFKRRLSRHVAELNSHPQHESDHRHARSLRLIADLSNQVEPNLRAKCN